jgi:hypothetical protein
LGQSIALTYREALTVLMFAVVVLLMAFVKVACMGSSSSAKNKGSKSVKRSSSGRGSSRRFEREGSLDSSNSSNSSGASYYEQKRKSKKKRSTAPEEPTFNADGAVQVETVPATHSQFRSSAPGPYAVRDSDRVNEPALDTPHAQQHVLSPSNRTRSEVIVAKSNNPGATTSNSKMNSNSNRLELKSSSTRTPNSNTPSSLRNIPEDTHLASDDDNDDKADVISWPDANSGPGSPSNGNNTLNSSNGSAHYKSRVGVGAGAGSGGVQEPLPLASPLGKKEKIPRPPVSHKPSFDYDDSLGKPSPLPNSSPNKSSPTGNQVLASPSLQAQERDYTYRTKLQKMRESQSANKERTDMDENYIV